MKIHELLIDQAIFNYKIYFEDDLEEDFEYLDTIPYSEKKDFLSVYDYSMMLTGNSTQYASHYIVPKEQDPEYGLLRRSLDSWHLMDKEILPKLKNINKLDLSIVENTPEKLN